MSIDDLAKEPLRRGIEEVSKGMIKSGDYKMILIGASIGALMWGYYKLYKWAVSDLPKGVKE